MKRWIPLIAFLCLGVFLGIGLTLDPHRLPNMLQDKPLPAFVAPTLDGTKTVSSTELRGKPMVINVFASWCPTCVQENPVLLEYAKSSDVMVVGLAYKDQAEDTRAWLQRFGNPFDLVLQDPEGKIGIDLGITGAPESYFIDRTGVVRDKHVGELTWDSLADYARKIQ